MCLGRGGSTEWLALLFKLQACWKSTWLSECLAIHLHIQIMDGMIVQGVFGKVLGYYVQQACEHGRVIRLVCIATSESGLACHGCTV